MIEPVVTDQMKVDLLERLVVDRRHARGDPESSRYVDYFILKALAADARARLPGPADVALASLGQQVEAAKRQRARIGYCDIGVLQAVAEGVMAHWPVIRRALATITTEQQGETDAASANR